jgi:quinol-cytochrome oxidoreductase complex cytochrome b subunit
VVQIYDSPNFKMRLNSVRTLAIVDSHIISYPTPKNLNYMWSFGSAAGICLGIQILTGVFLAMHYVPKVEYAFYSVEHIMRNVKYGWILRYLHANGASMFFLVVYSHIFRGLYYGSYMHPRERLWISGVVIYILMMATAFIGYVLPWGQMSFWGATVITNLFSTIPFVGKNVVEWLWGGFSVGNPTLNRFFSLHYLVPFLIAGAALMHIALLHEVGSNNPLGVDCHEDKVFFYPYFYVKDLIFFYILILTFSFFLYFFPNVLNHSDNYIPANPLVTPAHIVPEWYFLPYYAILRCVPHKLGGVIAMGGAIVCFILLPFINTSEVRNTNFRPLYAWAFWMFFFNFIFLGWIGQKEVDEPFVTLGVISSLYYFAFFFVLVPGLGWLEKFLYTSKEI